MSSSPTSSYRSVSRDHDTGFPESVAAKTTSWRHPEANTNPGATLSSEDLDPARTLQRTRKSFMRHKYRRTLSHGRITEEIVIPQSKYGPGPVSSIDSAIDLHGPKSPSANEAFSRPSKDTDSIGHTDVSSINEETTPISPVSSNFGSKAESPRRKHFFTRFRRS